MLAGTTVLVSVNEDVVVRLVVVVLNHVEFAVAFPVGLQKAHAAVIVDLVVVVVMFVAFAEVVVPIVVEAGRVVESSGQKHVVVVTVNVVGQVHSSVHVLVVLKVKVVNQGVGVFGGNIVVVRIAVVVVLVLAVGGGEVVLVAFHAGLFPNILTLHVVKIIGRVVVIVSVELVELVELRKMPVVVIVVAALVVEFVQTVEVLNCPWRVVVTSLAVVFVRNVELLDNRLGANLQRVAVLVVIRGLLDVVVVVWVVFSVVLTSQTHSSAELVTRVVVVYDGVVVAFMLTFPVNMNVVRVVVCLVVVFKMRVVEFPIDMFTMRMVEVRLHVVVGVDVVDMFMLEFTVVMLNMRVLEVRLDEDVGRVVVVVFVVFASPLSPTLHVVVVVLLVKAVELLKFVILVVVVAFRGVNAGHAHSAVVVLVMVVGRTTGHVHSVVVVVSVRVVVAMAPLDVMATFGYMAVFL